MNERYKFIDIAKGITIILVIIGHLVDVHSRLSEFIYSFHMVAFFVLTAIVTKNNFFRLNFLSKVVHLSNLWMRFFLYSFLFILFSLIKGYISNDTNTLSHLMTNIFLTFSLNGIGVLWFLSSLCISLLIVSYVDGIKNNFKYIILICFLLISLYVDKNIFYNSSQNIEGKLLYNIIISLSRVFIIIPFLSFGIFLSKYIIYLNKIIDTNVKFQYLNMSIIIILFIVLLKTTSINGLVDIHQMKLGNNFLLFMLNSVLGVFFIIGLSFLICTFDFINLFSEIGKYSLIIMIYHNYFGIPEMVNFLSKIVYQVIPINILIIELLITFLFLFVVKISFADFFEKKISAFIYKLKNNSKNVKIERG